MNLSAMKMRAASAWVIAALPIVVVVGLVLLVTVQPVVVLPRHGLAPGFALTDQHGATLSSEDLRGSVVLYSFARGCAAGCGPPSLLAALSARLDAQPVAEPAVRLVTLALDRSPDAPVQDRAVPSLPRWALLSGEPARMEQVLASGFGGVEAANPTGVLTPLPTLVLVDGWGIVRADYRRATPTVDRLMRDIQLVVDEARQSDGVARYAYEAAHVLACYAR